MLNQADHHKFHGQFRRVRVGTHQVQARQLVAVGLKQVGKGHRLAFKANNGHAKVLDIVLAETPQGEAFFAHVLAGEPGIGNDFELIHRRFARFMDFQ